MEGEHDEEELSFVRLAAATANVVRFLETQKQESEHRKPDHQQQQQQTRRHQQRLPARTARPDHLRERHLAPFNVP